MRGTVRAMGKQRDAGLPRKQESIRQRVLETLNKLHLDFVELGQLEDAGPLLHELMRIGYSAALPPSELGAFEPPLPHANGKEE
ncbi:MAG: hypothetical protein WCA81_16300 [Rhizomicrobium sp.]